MKLLRSATTVVLLLSMLLSLFACGSSTQSDTQEPTTDDTEKTDKEETVLCPECKAENQGQRDPDGRKWGEEPEEEPDDEPDEVIPGEICRGDLHHMGVEASFAQDEGEERGE